MANVYKIYNKIIKLYSQIFKELNELRKNTMFIYLNVQIF